MLAHGGEVFEARVAQTHLRVVAVRQPVPQKVHQAAGLPGPVHDAVLALVVAGVPFVFVRALHGDGVVHQPEQVAHFVEPDAVFGVLTQPFGQEASGPQPAGVLQ